MGEHPEELKLDGEAVRKVKERLQQQLLSAQFQLPPAQPFQFSLTVNGESSLERGNREAAERRQEFFRTHGPDESEIKRAGMLAEASRFFSVDSERGSRRELEESLKAAQQEQRPHSPK